MSVPQPPTGSASGGAPSVADAGAPNAAGAGGIAPENTLGAGGTALPPADAGESSAGGASADAGSVDPACEPRVGYRNLFTEILGQSEEDVQQKLDLAFEQLFYGDGQQQVYYESGADEAYILDVNSNDVRSEGMSYGMMIALQYDKQAEFDRLWKWAKSHMQQPSGYFSWQATSSGNVLSNSVAPDGEEYFATALIFAAHRWGAGDVDYAGEASALLNALVTGGAFNPENYLVRFGPSGSGSMYTDPSYVLPAFYEVWACYDETNRAFWKSAVSAGRELLQNAAHPTTGLAPYLSQFDGSPHPNGSNFNADSWRVVGNIMMDHHLFAADPWQSTFAENYAAFFAQAWAADPNADQFAISGAVVRSSGGRPSGLVAQNGLVAFAAPAELGTPFLEDLWELQIPSGQYRYYDGMLYLFALLHASGNFRIY